MELQCLYCKKLISGQARIYPSGAVHKSCENAYERKLKGLVHDCPKWKTAGKMPHPQGMTEKVKVKCDPPGSSPCGYNGCRGCPMCGYEMVSRLIMVECNLCGGIGYLTKKPTPIKTVTDWKV
jgi:hypothetical protein